MPCHLTMQDETTPLIETVYRTLLEMAAGRFADGAHFRADDSETDSLVRILELLSQLLRQDILSKGFGFLPAGAQQLVQHTFLIDGELRIDSFTEDFPKALKLEPEALRGRSFDTIMDDPTRFAWQLLQFALGKDPSFHRTFQFTFLSDGKPLPTFCTLSRLLHSQFTIVSAVSIVTPETALFNPLLTAGNDPAAKAPHHDKALLSQVHDYIKTHLETPLPTLRELSRKFGTNELKLKQGFRHFFQTSIYQFYQDERLKRAHLLIQQTHSPLADISEMCGFLTYPTFSRAFRKRFGYTPKQVAREAAE